MIIFDFDGTLVDLWPRYCAVFNDILKSSVSLNKYKLAKQSLKNDRLVAESFGIVLPKDYYEKKDFF